jgi:hypothetical protein
LSSEKPIGFLVGTRAVFSRKKKAKPHVQIRIAAASGLGTIFFHQNQFAMKQP